MKKVILFMFALTIGLGLVSCSSDDDAVGPQFTMVGTWKVSKLYIGDQQQDISNSCELKGVFKFIDGGTYVEDVYDVNENNACVLDATIGGTWVKTNNSYKITITTPNSESFLPSTITPILDPNNVKTFELVNTSLGVTTRVVFTKQ